MQRLAGLVVATMAGWLLSTAAPAQTLQSMQVQYVQQQPHVWLEGVSPFFWNAVASDAVVTVDGRSISIALCANGGFSVMTPWQLSVRLPHLPETSIYAIGVYLQCGGPEREQIGFLSAWVGGGADVDPIFSANFD